jgi:serine/threonine-protein kinase
VGDFGLAKSFDLAGLSGMTATGTLLGTPVFTPRQQVINFKYAKPEVDVWALAASFYHMVTGAFPRDFPPGMDPWLAVLRTTPVPIRQRDPSIPKKLAEVIDHALIDDPAIPFKTASDLTRVLGNVL